MIVATFKPGGIDLLTPLPCTPHAGRRSSALPLTADPLGIERSTYWAEMAWSRCLMNKLLALILCLGWLPVGADFPLIERRGRVLLIVDQSLATPLATAIDQFNLDLVGDGWEVTTTTGPRHADSTTGTYAPIYKTNQLLIKDKIISFYNQAPTDENVAILLGHLTVPYSGKGAEDEHKKEHCGAWSADSFYGDMNGTWTDSESLVCGSNVFFYNQPNDGKWDQATLPPEPDGSPGRLEVAIGRIDFSGMTDFVKTRLANYATNVDGVEIELTRKYLDKDHRFRMKQLTFSSGLRSFLEPTQSSVFEKSMGTTEEALVNAFAGPGYSVTTNSDLFLATTPTLWGLLGGYGSPSAVHGSEFAQKYKVHSTALIAQEGIKPNAAFLILAGSFFGDWQTWNPWSTPLMKACLAAENSALTASWSLRLVAPYSAPLSVGRFAQGAHYGTIIQDTYRDLPNASARVLFCLGDPTLHAFIATPPTGLTATPTPNGVRLIWNLPPGLTAYVDRAVYSNFSNTWGTWTRLTPTPNAAGQLEDQTAPPSVPKRYRVRAVERLSIGSQTGNVLSQGALTTIN